MVEIIKVNEITRPEVSHRRSNPFLGWKCQGMKGTKKLKEPGEGVRTSQEGGRVPCQIQRTANKQSTHDVGSARMCLTDTSWMN